MASGAAALHGRERRGLDLWRRFRRHRSGMVGLSVTLLFVLMAVFGRLLAPYDPAQPDYLHVNAGISAAHWMGTDNFGRDILSRTLTGARYSLGIGVLATVFSSLIGSIWGLLAGYLGGWFDGLSGRVIDIMLAFPGLLLAIGIIAIAGPGFRNVILATTIFGIPIFARLVRGSALALKERAYIEASQALAAGSSRIMFLHVLPNILAPILVYVTLRIGTVILIAASLSFLGLGVQPPTPEWGAMLSEAQLYLAIDPLMAIVPGVAISIAVLGFNLLGDGLRDVLDPRIR
ncbi:MAG TPA: ABC transporter permease subunit [Trueperaceae bacterium]|nr:ABC transporter permease subunit [Trueperaceae bacterium]